MKSFILITLDSVPWSVFLYARTPWINSLGVPICGRSHGDNTISSHHALFAGHFPSTHGTRKPRFGPNMATYFGAKGYATFGAVALPYLYPQFGFDRGFEEYKYRVENGVKGTYICPLVENLKFLSWHMEKATDPVFAFLNVGETHFPYHHKGEPLPEWLHVDVGKPGRALYEANHLMLRAQVRQLEWIDLVLSEVSWPEGAVFYVTADHGECFGEDGLYNHNQGSHPQEIYVPVICSDWEWLHESETGSS